MKGRAPISRLLVYAEDHQVYAQALRKELGDSLIIESTPNREEARRLLPAQHAVAALGTRLDDGLLAAAPQLRWIHALTSGVDNILGSRSLPTSAVITSSRGIHGPQMAEAAILLMMALVRQLPRMLQNQGCSTWERWPQPLLFGKHLVIVGVGSVARALAPRCKALGMRVTGVSTTARPVANFDDVRLRSQLPETLGTADFVVLLLPLDDTSRGLFGVQMLAKLPAHAVLVNLSRGGVVDEGALLAALKGGRLAGAGMDVFTAEPLPTDSPLWRAPNLIVTPHIGGFSDTYAQQALVPLLTNARAMVEGRLEDLVNRVR